MEIYNTTSMQEYGEIRDFFTTYPLMEVKAWRVEITSVSWNEEAFICREIFQYDSKNINVNHSKSKKPVDNKTNEETGYQIEKENVKVIK